MSVTTESKRYTPEEYLEREANAEERHEYIDGDITVIAGGTPNHNRVAGNLFAFLNFSLKRQPYDVFIAEQRLWIPERRIYTYPDVMVVSGEIQLQEERNDTILNPLVIAEVLSPSTRGYDKGDKFSAYRTLESFREYVLIEQDSPHVEHYLKMDVDRWLFSEYHGIDASFKLGAIALEIQFADLYVSRARFKTPRI
ncbi:Uma2 family endonuclease [Baaleninema simplex]|uniref:Uma2 family endonuclease n=1 Tax=Baaleninema simplex TaxID=2862350 RepID=UPI00034604AD|nr:Uma2 family endonuclease [Baaleninema simplex]